MESDANIKFGVCKGCGRSGPILKETKMCFGPRQPKCIKRIAKRMLRKGDPATQGVIDGLRSGDNAQHEVNADDQGTKEGECEVSST